MALASITACGSYDPQEVKAALTAAIEAVGGLDWITPGMRVALKTNLVTGSAPEKACVTHPAVLAALTELLRERGASVVIGDSPGGPFSLPALRHAYRASGMEAAEAAGASLNENTDAADCSFPEGTIMKQLSCTAWLLEADAVISVCKLKTHGMMRMSANVKNLFGAIPGTVKLEYHYRFPRHEDFADMLVDLNEFLRPKLYITDAVVGMEGNGPTAGTPRAIGALMASKDPYTLDEICARVIGLEPEAVPTIAAARKRGLGCSDPERADISGDYRRYIVPDYRNVTETADISFRGMFLPGFLVPVVRKLLESRPEVRADACVGCAKCANICPAKAITMTEGKPSIDRSRCIRCFCCQEFCPKGAMKVKRGRFARLLGKL